jgi:hypothetical protein
MAGEGEMIRLERFASLEGAKTRKCEHVAVNGMLAFAEVLMRFRTEAEPGAYVICQRCSDAIVVFSEDGEP